MNATVTIGRSSECNIMVSDGNVSRIHARISRVGGQYVFEDVSSNGSVLNGQVIHGRRITVAPGANILLAGRVPFPWNEVYKMLPMGPVSPYELETQYNNLGGNPGYAPAYNNEDRCPAGFWILSFFFPIVGWILWGVWHNRLPNRARRVCQAAWVGFGVNVGFFFMSMLAAMS